MATIKRYNELITERLGVNKDVEILSEFIIESLAKAEPGKTYIFQREDTPIADFQKKLNKDKNVVFIYNLPKLETNVYKIIIDYVDSRKNKSFPGEALFNPGTSKYTKNGFIFNFAFLYREERGKKIWKHYIYHEVNHALQFTKIGKKKTMFNPKYLRNNILTQMFPVFPYNMFLQKIYSTIKIEQGSFVTQLYGKVKNRKEIKTPDDLRKYFTKKTNYEYRIADDLKKIDVEKLFNMKIKDPEGNVFPATSREDMRQFFTLYKIFGKKIHEFKDIEEFSKNIPFKVDMKNLISEEELDATLKNYTKYFNKTGAKMERKLDKIYSLLLDYYNEEGFEKRRKELEPKVEDETTKTPSELKKFMDWFDGETPSVKRSKEFLNKLNKEENEELKESVEIEEEKENLAYKLEPYNNVEEMSENLTDEQFDRLFYDLIDNLFAPYIGTKAQITFKARKCKDPINLDPNNIDESLFSEEEEYTVNLIGYHFLMTMILLKSKENGVEQFYLLNLLDSAETPDKYPIWVESETLSGEDPYGEEIW